MSGPNRYDGVLIPWLTPIRAAKGPLCNAGVGRSPVLHFVGLLVFVSGITVFDEVFWRHELYRELGHATKSDAWTATKIFTFRVLGIELLFLLLGWVTTCMGGLTIGTYAALVGTMVLFGAGTLVGSIVRVIGKRDIMPAACHADCYSAALLPVWVLLQGGQIMILMPLDRYLHEIHRYDLGNMFPLLVLLLHGVMLI